MLLLCQWFSFYPAVLKVSGYSGRAGRQSSGRWGKQNPHWRSHIRRFSRIIFKYDMGICRPYTKTLQDLGRVRLRKSYLNDLMEPSISAHFCWVKAMKFGTDVGLNVSPSQVPILFHNCNNILFQIFTCWLFLARSPVSARQNVNTAWTTDHILDEHITWSTGVLLTPPDANPNVSRNLCCLVTPYGVRERERKRGGQREGWRLQHICTVLFY